jgi:hypothetical protein
VAAANFRLFSPAVGDALPVNATFGRFLDTPAAEFQRVTDVTYLGTVNGTRVGEARRVNHGKLATGRPDQPTGRPGEVVGKDELMARALPDTLRACAGGSRKPADPKCILSITGSTRPLTSRRRTDLDDALRRANQRINYGPS